MSWPPAIGVSRPLVSTRWYDQTTAGVYDPASGTPLQENRYYFAPFNQWKFEKSLFRSIGIDVDAAPTGDVTLLLGVYTSNKDSGQPDKLLLQTEYTATALAGTGAVELPFAISLETGIHWLCWINTAPNGMRVGGWDSGTATEGFSMLGDESPAANTSIPKRWGWTAAALAFPPSLPASMAGFSLSVWDRIPRICLQAR